MEILTTLGAITGIGGALLLAINIPQSRFGFPLFLISSICWAVVALQTQQNALFMNQVVFLIINLIGVCRWFGNSRTQDNRVLGENTLNSVDVPLSHH